MNFWASSGVPENGIISNGEADFSSDFSSFLQFQEGEDQAASPQPLDRKTPALSPRLLF